ncbi:MULTISPECIES: helix-turn-helix domain-containing protein [unclassified Streptomyces]|uniref:helix-turn-helix domain-containing protein n=1 Tax=unclassified Streptomyces TaxID=2593676 RepID=UPI00202571CA|nr:MULTISPECIES: helix-turn-helix transcriptional regulator [unclassified Streptomyces]MCX4550627.1 helix-turn-helix transcriptional regulator [Streptomyces sp. NBC_01500]
MTPQPPQGSKADREALRHEMTACGFTTEQVAVEMRSRWRMRPREAWRHALGWTLQKAADRLSTAPGPAIAADASLVAKWEKWPGPSSRRPTLQVLAALAVTYGCTVEDLLDIEDRRALPEGDLRVLDHVPEPTPHSQESIQPADPEPEPDRVLAAAAESASWAQWAESTNVGDIALEQLFADVQTLAGDYLTGDPLLMFRRTRELRDRVFRLLEGHQPPRQSADLYVSAGYVCGLLAWMSSDLGNLRAADTHGRTAWLCAENAGHAALRAWVYSTRSKVALWDGRLRDAVNHARRGSLVTVDGTVGALLACQEADAWSVLGAVDEAEGALARAVQARENATGGDDVGGLFSCPQARQENYAAAVHLRIGRPQAALAETQTALELLAAQPVRAYGTEAQIHISQATALLACGHPEGVLEALLPVLAMPAERRMGPVTQRMRELAAAMTGRPVADSNATASARRTIVDWCADSAPQQLALSSGEAAGWLDLAHELRT